jgi:hypothetical protein
MVAGDRVSAKLGVAVKANAQNATVDAVVIWRIVFIVRSNQFEALGVFKLLASAHMVAGLRMANGKFRRQ